MLLGLVALLDLIVLYFTATRGAILGLLGGALVTFIFLMVKSEKGDQIRKVAKIGLVALVVFLGAFFLLRNTPLVKESPVLSRFASGSHRSGSGNRTQVRSSSWKIKSFPGSIVHGHGEVLNQDILSLHNSVHAAYEAIHGRPLAQKDEKGVFYFHRRLLSQGRFKLIIANSQLMKADLMARYSIPSSKIRVIYPGYDPRQFSPSARASARQELRRSMGVTSEEILIGLVTSGDFVKRGVKTFVSTIASLPANTRKRMKALIVGREKRVDVLREECRRLGIADRVIFKESIPDVQNYYYAMDLMVYPAFFEEFGQVVQEAAACGVPVLTSKMVGASELFQGLAKSYLPDRAVADEFAKRLDELIAHPDRLKPWGEAARESVQQNTWDRNCELTLQCYDELSPSDPGIPVRR
jgi:UDP-glucose:(heptosyl)LPS alpha-1,3-glucosyltransferase